MLPFFVMSAYDETGVVGQMLMRFLDEGKKITIGVFDNNMSAYNCYKSLGFVELTEKAEVYRIGDEDWKCLEMEMDV